MDDELLPIIGASILGVTLAGLLGSCAHDYIKSTPQVSEVVVVDKRYEPEYYSTSCTSDGKNMSCYPQYHGPSWTVKYQDGATEFTIDVSSGTYETLKLGEKKIIRFDLGGGYWHSRYNTRFVFNTTAEAGWPAR